MSAQGASAQLARQGHWMNQVVVLAVALIIGAGVTYVQVERPSLRVLPAAQAPQQRDVAPVVSAPAQQPASSSTAQPAASTPTTQSTAKPVKKMAATASFVNVRQTKSTTSAIMKTLEAGTMVELSADSDPIWQGVIIGGKVGYIYKEYLRY